MILQLRNLALIALCGLAAACATDRTFGTAAELEITELEQLPAPLGEIYHTISQQETLDIYIANAETLSGPYLTDDRARITFPLIGELDLYGKTPSEAARMIADGLRGDFMIDPQVRVIPSALPPPSISVGGQVEEPGSYPATGNATLLRIVNLAGGLSEYARLDDVLVMRVVDGQNYIGVYNIGAIQRGNYADPALYPNDIVMVGDSPNRRRLDNFLQFAPIISSAAIIIDRATRSR
ncbi:MAG TPA: polysaccharide export protein [Erythrobacter sp.]|nr:polysaccharide export protein [Erythrobacter sp.]